jgi:hypothetical protein
MIAPIEKREFHSIAELGKTAFCLRNVDIAAVPAGVLASSQQR